MKRVKRYLLILVCIMLLNGCVKNNTTMKINKDKSMNYRHDPVAGKKRI